MGRPKGSVNKKKVNNSTETVENSDIEVQAEVITNADVREEKEEREEVLTKKAPALEPILPSQAYFEAPDGTILVGEASADRMWYRAGNDGKGMWINRKR